MANEGALVNGLMLVLSAGTFFLSVYLERHSWKGSLSATTIGLSTVFWILAGALTFFMGVRQIFAYFGLYGLDKTAFYLAGIPGSIIAAPVIGIVVYILSGSAKKASAASILVAILAAVSVLLSATEGISGPNVTYWGTQYDLNSELAKAIILFGLFIPGVVASSILLIFSKFSGSGRVEESLFYSSLSMLLLMGSISLDTIVGGFNAILLMFFRLLVFVSALLAFRAYAVHANRNA